MTQHKDIISRIGPVRLAAEIGVERNSVYQWRRTDSIPAPYWKAIILKGLATTDELLEASALKRDTRQPLSTASA